MLAVENLTKTFGPQILFERATFSVEDEARIGVIGPNGAGKSTFFRMLAGEEGADSGMIRFPRGYRIALMRQDWIPGPDDTLLDAALRGHGEWFTARKKLRELEVRLEREHTEEALRTYHDAETAFVGAGGYGVEQTARELLTGLGFHPEEFARPAHIFSGGWRMRCHLAGLLLERAELLLLDEPTNHLDMETVVWLEDFLRQYPHAVMLISHDRRLIERTAKDILEFAPPKLTFWPGNLKRFEEQKETRIAQMEGEIANRQKKIDQLQEFADRFRAKASKARQAQNKLRTADSYREELAEIRAAMPVVVRRPSRFRLKIRRRLPRIVLEIERGRFGYTAEKPLFDLEHCIVEGGKKIGIVGVNGVGKTTFLRSCAGELPLLSGKIVRADTAGIGYFAQHRMEELPAGFEAFDYLYGGAEGNTIPEVRAVAAALGLTENDLEKRTEILSGGEKARLSLSRILLSRPGLLLLDEPTNHLDLEACDALVRGLSDYEGTVLVVSHDRGFLDTLVDYILEIRPGAAHLHHGNYTDWYRRTHGEKIVVTETRVEEGDSPSRKNKDEKRKAAEERQARSKELKEVRSAVAKVEKELNERRVELRTLDDKLCRADAPKDPNYSTWLKERSHAAAAVERLEGRWMEAAEALEKAERA
ncbi:MAG: ABC-F family ATP-binding cassette domain-containing protein [Pseudomonadota bacterium]